MKHPPLSAVHWQAQRYEREHLPVRVLQFGTGMLLRGLCVACIDQANGAGRFNGRVVALQSTPVGKSEAINAQAGLYTLVERGIEAGRQIEWTHIVGAVDRALILDRELEAACELAAQPQLQIIVTNTSEAGFHEPVFHTRLSALLRRRFERLGSNAPLLFVIPTELVENNGPTLATLIRQTLRSLGDAAAFQEWIAARVRFCSSLVDRIVTGPPVGDDRARLEDELGYTDALLTVCEPYHLWAIECEPAELRAAFDIECKGAAFASNIAPLRDRKVRLLNGAHTAVAPVALLAGIATVREAVEHPVLAPFLKHLLLSELVPSMSSATHAARAFALSVLERFGNPWLEHAWRVIATDQETKMRLRVVPSIVAYAERFGRPPPALALSIAALLHRAQLAGDRSLETTQRVLADAARWGTDLTRVVGLASSVTLHLQSLWREGLIARLSRFNGEHGDGD